MKVVFVFLSILSLAAQIALADDICKIFKEDQKSIFDKYTLENHDEGICNFTIVLEYMCDNDLHQIVSLRNLSDFSCWYGTSEHILINENGDIYFDENYRGNFYEVSSKYRSKHFFMLDDANYNIRVYLDREDKSSLIFSFPGGDSTLFTSADGGRIYASEGANFSWDRDKHRRGEWIVFPPND